MSSKPLLNLRARALHWVFKIGDRDKTMHFYRDVLGMKVLRHEEFDEGCKATCNGPYNGKWSKTMMGYGPEDNHFVIELTYNYGVDKYRLGNDFLGITLCDATNRIVERATKAHEGLVKRIDEKTTEIEAPDGYKFFVVHAESAHGDPVRMVTISCRCLKTSLTFWHDILGMKKEHDSHNPGGVVFLTFGEGQARLGLKELGGGTHVDHATAFGRIAFAVPARQLPEIERIVAEFGQILTPLTKLDTPGKASVEVVIVADPDGHEICFVGDEAFKELAQVDPQATKLLDEAMAADKSKEWFAKKGLSKMEA